MKTTSFLLALLPSLAAGASLERRQTKWTVGQTVETSSGPVSGHAAKNATAKEVSEYLGIPFGKAPTGDLRFSAPVKFEGTAPLKGDAYGPSCPLRTSTGGGLTAQALDQANITAAGPAVLTVLSNNLGLYSEDCLNLNVWTKPQTGEEKKAVLVWLYGGGFSSGSSAIPGYNGANLVEEQDVIVVSLNYRLSILGWPGNPDDTENLGLLDQRLAVEWIRDNIANFGGDPERIILFGQSAGGASVDLYAYAFPDDPIVAGIIPQSGNTYGWNLPNSEAFGANYWYNVTTTVGCGNADTPEDELLKCMRSKNATAILDAVPQLSGAAGILGAFGPTDDEVIVFANITDRTPAKIPMLIGSTNYESGLFRVQFGLRGEFIGDEAWSALTLQAFTCPAGLRANASVEDGIPTWRYRYFGIFPNLAISAESGAWHASELPMLFNTAPNGIPATTEQISIGKYMRGAWAAFAKDPTNGLTNYGWPRYDPSQDTLVRLAYDNITGPNLINPRRYDADCVFVDVHNTDQNNLPKQPDLGASITPTGSPTPSQTGASSTSGSASGTAAASASSSPKSTSGAAATGRLGSGSAAWSVLVLLTAMFAFFL